MVLPLVAKPNPKMHTLFRNRANQALFTDSYDNDASPHPTSQTQKCLLSHKSPRPTKLLACPMNNETPNLRGIRGLCIGFERDSQLEAEG